MYIKVLKKAFFFQSILISAIFVLSCTLSPNQDDPDAPISKGIDEHLLQKLLQAADDGNAGTELTITYPYHDAVFPPEIASPIIGWLDQGEKKRNWFIAVSFNNGSLPIYHISRKIFWQIEKPIWETIKSRAAGNTVDISISGFDPAAPERLLSYGQVTIRFSKEAIQAAVLYRQVPLPFPVNNLKEMKWRLGDIASYSPPKIIMEGINFCASCHVGSTDGKYLSMEMNYGNDPGAQFVAPVEKKITLSKDDFFSWNDIGRPGILPRSRGLFGRMSPTANYALATVNELSLALLTNDYRFSQVFFPTYGILAWYSVADKTFAPLPGADDYNYVQTNPDWSPDETHVVFARAKTKNEVHDNILDVSPKFKDEDIYSLNKRFNIQFDLYRIPFNKGSGGTAVPLEGAHSNSMSNYFPRHSPDGKWIVFTQSKTGIMLQPDSQLYIIPATGGKARKMRCNRDLFNSWHSWAPNSRWLIFSSKTNTPFTEIFLTYIDEDGIDYPPVLLHRFSDDAFAANVPEFVNFSPDKLDMITVQ